MSTKLVQMIRKLRERISSVDGNALASLVCFMLAIMLVSLTSAPRFATAGFNVTERGAQAAQQVLGMSAAGNINANWLPEIMATNQTQDFRLEIPKIGLSHRVIENVDPASEEVYGPVINNYIAHGMYTRLPDEATSNGNVYLFAHREGRFEGRNIGYFSQLDKLEVGDRAVVTYGGKKYIYEYWRSFVITPQDTWVYTGESSFPMLTLQTCENGLSARLMVQFRLVEVT